MKRWSVILVLALTGLVVGSQLVSAQAKPDCTPHKVEGRIVKVDMEQGKLVLQGSDGKTVEFNAAKEVLQDKKVGDRLEVTKRLPEGCK